ncbi:MAG: response regulator [Chloroflexi bacterium]|nr:response regulator [Chloroflexota bacterium]
MGNQPSETPRGDILIVDDTPDNLRLLSTFLTDQGFKVRSVISGPMALTATRSSPPDLILLDITMPEMNGYEVSQRLKQDEQTRDIPIIFISALNETLDKVKAFSVGGVDFITKPFQFEEVLARVETHLSLRKLQTQLQTLNDELEGRVEARTAELVELNSAYERFVPREFLSYLDKKSITDVKLGDQMQQDMTIMFSDLRSFTTLSENMTPQENFNFLNSYLSKISPVIRENDGFIDTYIGDAVMSLFPKSPDDALQAAIAMSHELTDYNALREEMGHEPISVGTGLHTGSLMLGIIGGEQRMQGTVISDAVNLASRIERLTKKYGVSVIACERTLASLEDTSIYNYRFIDRVQVEGKTEPVTVFEVFDCDTDEMVELKLRTKDDFEEGLHLYYDKKFAEASVKFNRVLELNPEDIAARIYLERAAHFMVHGVPSDWVGVEALTEK